MLRIRNGRLIDPQQGIDAEVDLLIENGKVAALGKAAMRDAAETIDAKGLVVVPGLVDIHTHLREPGLEYKETIETGSRAAVAGGFTSIACMPNTEPINDNRAITEFIVGRAKDLAGCHVYPIAAITKDSGGETLTEMADLKLGGAVGFSDDGRPVMNARVMRLAMEIARSLRMPILAHEEDIQLSAGGVMREGAVSTRLGLRGIPAQSESTMIARDVELAELTGVHLHICHVSSVRSLKTIELAKQWRCRVTCEVTPHHLMLTDEDIAGFDARYKVNPPLGFKTDREALRVALADGLIDVIATDHAPHHQDEKRCEFEQAMFGMIGLETALPLCLSLVRDGVISLRELIRRMTIEPAKILGLAVGALAVGAIADVTLFDPNESWTVGDAPHFSRSTNTPFWGKSLTGRVKATIVGGKVVYRDGEML